MSLLVVTHELGFQHRTPRGHPERVDRLTAALAGLRSSGADVVEVEAPLVERGVLEQVHDPRYIDDFHAFCADGGGAIDPDTYAVPATWEASLRAAGAGPAAVDALVDGVAETAFVAVRPPGHHAERGQAMGFCFFNNVAVTAAYLRGMGERIAIVDWDVHHGNGTQHTFYRDPDVLYLSLHEFPFYPGTGWISETGTGPGAGTSVNVAVPTATSADHYMAAFGRVILPIVAEFAPDWLLVSAGYDAHRDDPLGRLQLRTEDYATMAGTLAGVVPAKRTVGFLEGGYDLDAIEASTRSSVRGSLGLDEPLPLPTEIGGSAKRVVDLVVAELSEFWDIS